MHNPPVPVTPPKSSAASGAATLRQPTVPAAAPPGAAAGGRRLPVLLRHAWYGLNQSFRRRLQPLGLTPDQFTTLRTLLEGDPAGLTQRQLAERMASDANTITSLLGRMEQAGLVHRQRHERDRRARRVRVLPLGQDRFDAAQSIALDLQAEVAGSFSPPIYERFLGDLEQVAERCRRLAR